MKNILRNFTLLSCIALVCNNLSYSQVPPLMTTNWNQGCYYNDQCPTDLSGPCDNVYTGCAATALSQIMKYHSHPVNGWGSYSYTPSGYPLQSADFSSANYDWMTMPNSLGSPNSEVAKIMHHLGISMDMIYSPTVSNAFFENPLKKYFKYALTASSALKFSYTTTEWEDLLIAELDAGRPVYVKGGSHFWVVDGYQLGPLEFHCNFGWGGIHNGYYDIHNVVNGAGNFTPNNALIGIEPLTELEVSVDTVSLSAAGGSIGYELSSLLSWTGTSSVGWIVLDATSGSEGYYNFTNGAGATISANGTYISRYGVISYTDGSVIKEIVVEQFGILPTLSVSQSLIAESAGGGTTSINIGCDSNWVATSPESWLTITPMSGVGSSATDIIVAANPLASDRVGSVSITRGIMQEVITVTQTGLGATWCTPIMSVPNSNGIDNVALNTIDRTSAIDEGYILTTDTTILKLDSTYTINVSLVGSNAPAVWIDWNQDGDFNDFGEDVVSGSGSWYPTFGAIQSSPITVPATAFQGLTRMRVYAKAFGTGPVLDPCSIVDVGGDIEDYHIIVKDHKHIDVVPGNLNYGFIGGLQNVTVDVDSTWTAISSSTWLTISPNTGTGNATVGITADPNTSTTPRNGTVIFDRGNYSQSVIISQVGEDSVITISPTSLSFNSGGGVDQFDITSNVDYTITSSQGWLTTSAVSGSGNLTVDLTCANNPLSSVRNAMIIASSGTISDTIFISQDSTSGTLMVSPTLLNYTWNGSAQSFMITTPSGWNLSTSDSWFQPDLISGSGNATVNVAVDTNYLALARSGTIEVTNGLLSESITVNQDSTGVTYISALDHDLDWNIFPNPASDWITIKRSSNELVQIQLLDASGSLVLSKFSNDSTLEIDLTILPGGTYYVVLLQTEGRSIRKLVKN